MLSFVVINHRRDACVSIVTVCWRSISERRTPGFWGAAPRTRARHRAVLGRRFTDDGAAHQRAAS
jgi:hypothetical protein